MSKSSSKLLRSQDHQRITKQKIPKGFVFNQDISTWSHISYNVCNILCLRFLYTQESNLTITHLPWCTLKGDSIYMCRMECTLNLLTSKLQNMRLCFKLFEHYCLMTSMIRGYKKIKAQLNTPPSHLQVVFL